MKENIITLVVNGLKVKDTKVESEDFYLLTLAAITEELGNRGNILKSNVYLAVGLPLTRFGEEKQPFIDYLSKKEEISFKFEEGVSYQNCKSFSLSTVLFRQLLR